MNNNTITLTPEEHRRVDKAINRIGRTKLFTDKFLEVFTDWKSKRTLAAHRVTVTTTIITIAAATLGIEPNQLAIIGTRSTSASSVEVSAFVFVILLAASTIYAISRYIDSEVRTVKVRSTDNPIQKLKRERAVIIEILKRHIDQPPELIEQAQIDAIGFPRDTRDVLAGLRVYEETIEPFRTSSENIDAYWHRATISLAAVAMLRLLWWIVEPLVLVIVG